MIAARPVRLGLRANLAQFALLVGVNALVGGMLGQERTVLPLIATRVFHLHAYSAVLTYIVAFGAVKAATNFAAGTISERVGRKPVLVAGWLIAAPVPFLPGWGPGWAWIVVANVLLGVSQGLTWSCLETRQPRLASRRERDYGPPEVVGPGCYSSSSFNSSAFAGRHPRDGQPSLAWPSIRGRLVNSRNRPSRIPVDRGPGLGRLTRAERIRAPGAGNHGGAASQVTSTSSARARVAGEPIAGQAAELCRKAGGR
jgi:hypothetical protein